MPSDLNQRDTVRDERTPGHYWADNEIVDVHCRTIGAAAFMVYHALCRYAGNTGRCWPSMGKLAEVCGCSSNTIRTAIRKLEAAKLITVRTRTKTVDGSAVPDSNEYTLLPILKGGTSNSEVGVLQEVKGGTSNSGRGVLQKLSPTKTHGRIHKEEELECVENRVSPTEIQPFDDAPASRSQSSALAPENQPGAADDSPTLIDAVTPPPSSAAPPSPRRERKPAAEPTPLVIRQAIADVCGIGLDIGRREDILQVNHTAKLLWKAAQSKGVPAEQVATSATYVGGWVRRNSWECQPRNGRPGELPTPAIVRKYWRPALEARDKARALVTLPAQLNQAPTLGQRQVDFAPRTNPETTLRVKRLALQGVEGAVASLTRLGMWPLSPDEAAAIGATL